MKPVFIVIDANQGHYTINVNAIAFFQMDNSGLVLTMVNGANFTVQETEASFLKKIKDAK